MPPHSTSLTDLAEHVRRLGVEHGSDVVVHSRLLSFGLIERGAQGVLEVLLESVGTTGNLVIPTYAFQLGPEDVYDPMSTPAPHMGVLSKAVIGRAGVRRGLCPIHNHSHIGPALFDLGDPEWSVGPNSSFDRLEEADFQLVLLGCGLQLGGTYVHHVEAEVGVEYREWRLLPRRIIDPKGSMTDIQVHYFARRPGIDDDAVDLTKLEQSLIASGELRRVPSFLGSSSMISLRALDAATRRGLRADPRLLCR